MAVQLSPGVTITEVDATTVVPSVSSTTGAFAGNFVWGPAGNPMMIDSEITLAKVFGKPDSNTYIQFFTAANFLAYANDLRITRAINSYSNNASSNSQTVPVQVKNEDIYIGSYSTANTANVYGPFIARYAGSFGNSIKVDVFDSASAATFAGWQYKGYFSGVPSTTAAATKVGGANDEFHIIVTDATGYITGNRGTILEVYPFVSKGFDAINDSGDTIYWKNVLFNKSKWIYGLDSVDYANTNATWGRTISGTSFQRTANASAGYTLSQGTDAAVTDSNIQTAYDTFNNPATIDISLILTGNASIPVQQYVIDNIVTTAGSGTGRNGDAVAFISPPSSNVVSQAGNETTNITNWYNALNRSSTYTIADSGWKYQLDKYNNIYRYIPLNADLAGLCVYTDSIRDPWYSPAGFNRGQIKNCIKLAWNPKQAERDSLYSIGINPVLSSPSDGTVLLGDKTLSGKPSAFDRINVRRLFIVLEKSIAKAAKYSLFEFNDTFTRAQFIALVTPYLREVKGRRGITNFYVVCDESNNTGQVIDNNQFIGDIYIKPARSINYIQLNFIAVGTSVAFNEIVGAI